MFSILKITKDKIYRFCIKWDIKELALFGSILRDDFDIDSDVDILITFNKSADWSLFDWIDMIDELKLIFGRKIDLVDKESIKNPFMKESILNNYEVIYAA